MLHSGSICSSFSHFHYIFTAFEFLSKWSNIIIYSEAIIYYSSKTLLDVARLPHFGWYAFSSAVNEMTVSSLLWKTRWAMITTVPNHIRFCILYWNAHIQMQTFKILYLWNGL